MGSEKCEAKLRFSLLRPVNSNKDNEFLQLGKYTSRFHASLHNELICFLFNPFWRVRGGVRSDSAGFEIFLKVQKRGFKTISFVWQYREVCIYFESRFGPYAWMVHESTNHSKAVCLRIAWTNLVENHLRIFPLAKRKSLQPSESRKMVTTHSYLGPISRNETLCPEDKLSEVFQFVVKPMPGTFAGLSEACIAASIFPALWEWMKFLLVPKLCKHSSEHCLTDPYTYTNHVFLNFEIIPCGLTKFGQLHKIKLCGL